MHRHKFRSALATLVAVLVAHPATGLTVTLNRVGVSTVETWAHDGSVKTSDDKFPTTIPDVDLGTTTSGPASSSSIWNLSDGGFNITFDHSRGSALGSYGFTDAYIYFSVDEDVDYAISGNYSAVDPDGSRLLLWTRLSSGAAFAETHLISRQESRSTVDESFTVGLSEGDFRNERIGSLTGTLVADHDYFLRVTSLLNVFPIANATGGATASGSVSLTFVPEPSSASLIVLGLVALAVRRRRAAARGRDRSSTLH